VIPAMGTHNGGTAEGHAASGRGTTLTVVIPLET